MMNEKIFKQLQNGMIVSCQSEGDDPFNLDPSYMALFAKAAQIGGASGIRTEGVEKLKCIKAAVDLPVIGLIKSKFSNGFVRITGSFSDVEDLIHAGADIIAIDGTFRMRDGYNGPDFIKEVKLRYGCVILADIATKEEAIACELAGADAVSTTLNGYTPETVTMSKEPNIKLLSQLCQSLHIPVFAEGRYNTPDDAALAINVGAFAVISGTAITRPRVITSWFVNKIKESRNIK